MIIEKLMEIYSSSILNDGKPECIFAETQIFNEGWLLRGILEKWKMWSKPSKFQFLPFPDNVRIYSEAQLFTPFKKRSRSDKQGEGHTHVDGIVGSFSIPDTKSGVVLDENCDYLAIFEAKVYSGLSDRTENIENYSQVSRILACIINSAIGSVVKSIYFTAMYPRDSKRVVPAKYTREFVEGEIEERLKGYRQAGLFGQVSPKFPSFEREWRDILNIIDVKFVTWESVLSELEDQNIDKFYRLCKEYNS